MNRLPRPDLATMLSAILPMGCSTASKEIKIKSESVKMDVFTEVQGAGPPPKGFVDLTIKTSIKTHVEGRHVIKWKEDLHGKPGISLRV